MNNLRKSLLVLFALLAFGPMAWAQTFGGGSGTTADPYLISNNDHWNALVDAVNNGTGSFASACYKLTDDVTGLYTMLGSEAHPFSGTFDGDGHKLGLDYRVNTTYYAPFRYVDGATIQNLQVTGGIHITNGMGVASFIAHSVGNTTLINCHSDVQLNTESSGVQHSGGMVAEVASGSITITGCLFNGIQLIFNGATQCGGFVGWLAQGATATLTDNLLNPYADLTFIGWESFSFVNAADPNAVTLVKCYHTCDDLGQNQGTRGRTIGGSDGVTVSFYGNATTYNVSGITSYDASPGIRQSGTLYATEGEQVSLNINNTVGATSYLVNTEPLIGSGNPYSFIMPNDNVNIYVALLGMGTQDDPYLIRTASDFYQIGTMVAAGQSFSGQYIRLDADISVNRMIGDQNHLFSGTFDGNGKTLTVNYNASESYLAPFRYVDGATFMNLTISGTINPAQRMLSGGLIGSTTGTTTITNCISNVTITCRTNEPNSRHGGFVAIADNSNLTFNGCAFTGKLLSSTTTGGCGGFVGMSHSTVNITGCLFYPSQVTMSGTNSHTFVRSIGGNVTITDSYYTQAFGNAQGEPIYIVNLADGITSSVTPFFGFPLSFSGPTITLACDSIPNGYEPVFTVRTSDNQNVAVDHVGDVYSFVMPAMHVTVSLGYNALPMDGDGTPDNPYVLLHTDHWRIMGNNVVNETSNYPTACYRLDADITVTNQIIGNDSHPFRGTFDGNGHTITMNYNGSSKGTAPFRVVNNATIRNLHVDGSLGCTNYNSSNCYHLGGLVGFANGTVTIENCRVSSDLHIRTYGGGIVGHGQSATLNITGCVFDGSILNTLSDTNNSQGVGGLVGWADQGCVMNLTDCLFAGNYTSDNPNEPFSPIACSVNGSNTTSVTNTYYIIPPDVDIDNNPNNVINTAAKQVFSIIGGEGVGVAIAGDGTTPYNVCGITYYDKGIKFNDTHYACNGDQVSLNIESVIPDNYVFMGYTVSSGILIGTDNPYTLTVKNDEAVINAKTAEEWQGDGSEGTPYLIYNTDQLDLLSYRVNNGTDYENLYFKLGADIEYNPNVLTIDFNGDGMNESNYTAIGLSDKAFRGNFDGDGHTISGIRLNNGATYQGLFGRCFSGEIKNLILSDADITGKNYTGGIAGYTGGNSFTNCHVTSSVIIRTSGNNVNYHGGLVGYNYIGTISFCTSSATLTIENGNNYDYYGSITGLNYYGTITDNFVIESTIPKTNRNYGIIAGSYIHSNTLGGTLQRNYYYDCTVTGLQFTTEIGCQGNDLDNTSNPQGAVVGYLLTLEDGVTSSASVIAIPEHKDLNSEGAEMETVAAVTYNVAAYRGTVTLGNTLPAGYTIDHYTVRGEAIEGNSFVMPNYNVTVGMVFLIDWAGTGNEVDPYLIYTTEQLDLLSERVNSGNNYHEKYFKLMNDLTYSYADLGETESNFTPIGSSQKFSGNFDGGNHTINGIRIYDGESQNQGLFGYVYKVNDNITCEVKNIILNDAVITGANYTGGIVGHMDGGTITNCHVTSSVVIRAVTKCNCHGGIAGYVEEWARNSLVSHCTSSATLTIEPGVTGCKYFGGIIGILSNRTEVSDNFVIGATIPVCAEDLYGAIAGTKSNADLYRNYYYNCRVGSNEITPTGVGCGYPNYSFIPSPTDFNTDDAAVPGYFITLGENITSNAHVFTIPAHGEIGEETYIVAAKGNTITLGYELPGDEPTYYVNGAAIVGNTFTMPAMAVTISVGEPIDIWEGDGSEENPWIITTTEEWDLLANTVAAGSSFRNKLFKLGNDITVSTMVGTNESDFCGTFDGDGKTLTFNKGTSEAYFNEDRCAPFRYVNGAIVKNLIVSGTIYTANQFAAGVVSNPSGNTTITNCRSSITIISSKSGEGSHGGFVGVFSSGTTTITGCVFDGSLLTTNGTTNCGGFVGWADNYVANLIMEDNLFAPTSVNMADGCKTFSRATYLNYISFTANNYYTTTLGDAQGKQMHSITGDENVTVAFAGDLTNYDVSGISTNGTGLMYNDVLYAGNVDEVSLTLNYNDGVEYMTFDGYSASAGTLTGSDSEYILVMPDEDVTISANILGITKFIRGYGESNGGYFLIASPVGTVSPTNVANMLSNNYDLYAFDQSPEDGMEWRNYKANTFDLEPGMGYLYANSEDVTLVFPGMPYTGSGEVTLSRTDDAGVDFQGWNLVGNPFTETVYIADNRPFYTMNADGTEIITSTSNSIEAMEGVFVVANTDGERMTFTTTAPESNGKGLVLNIRQGGVSAFGQVQGSTTSGSMAAVVDRAVVRFGEGGMLPKFQLNRNSTKVYIPMDGEDYAVVNAERAGELPVNFKAKENGSYTLSLSTEDVTFDYLHLVDNLTGNDVDLLPLLRGQGGLNQPAIYTFTASTTDYESRFKLVFACGDANDDNDFAFISNGNIIVNGEGTLQVIDVMGRIVLSGDAINCVSTNGMTEGVYVLRLINGNDVKTQKIVVRFDY